MQVNKERKFIGQFVVNRRIPAASAVPVPLNEHDLLTTGDILLAGLVRHPLLQAIILACVFLTGTMATAAANATETAGSSDSIRVEVTHGREIPVFSRVAVLPLRFPDNRVDRELTDALHQALDTTKKYVLVAPSPHDRLPPLAKTADPLASLRKSALAYGRGKHHRGVIAGVILPRKERSGCTELSMDCPVHQILLSLTDIAQTQPIWTLTLVPTPPDGSSQSRQQLHRLLHAGVEELLAKLIQQGDIYTSRLPVPRILSASMTSGHVRIAIQTEMDSTISAYQLLRGDVRDGVFTPIGEPVATRRTTLVIKDTDTERDRPGYYTVIGINSRGLANVPAPPLLVTTRTSMAAD